MTTPRGWCPSLHEPMLSGDGWLSRVKPHAARLTAAEARLIATEATRHGNGSLGLTQRGNLQPRGFSPESAGAFAGAMVAAGLARADRAVERGRNLLAPPLLGWDAGIAPGTAELVEALAGAMRDWPELHGKFGVLVDGGGVLGLGSVTADIGLHVGAHHVAVRLDGSAVQGVCQPAHAVAAATMLALACAAPGRRMRHVVAEQGAAALLAAAGLRPEAMPPARAAPASVGLLPGGVLGVAPPFGLLGAAQLAALATLAEQQGDGTLRLTPWRGLLLPGVHSTEAAAALGLIVSPDDARLRVVACTGAPGCASGWLDTRAAALQLAQRGLPGLLHVSGCAKGCAHPGPAPRVLVGGPDGLAVLREARAGGVPAATGLTWEDALAMLQ